VAVSLLAVVLRTLWSVVIDHGTGKLGERVIADHPRGRLRRFVGYPLTPLLAVVATASVFVWPLLRTPSGPWLDDVAVAIGVLTLPGVYLRSRAVVAGRERVKHFTWPPAIVFGSARSVSPSRPFPPRSSRSGARSVGSGRSCWRWPPRHCSASAAGTASP
jgi:hypothetical protein